MLLLQINELQWTNAKGHLSNQPNDGVVVPNISVGHRIVMFHTSGNETNSCNMEICVPWGDLSMTPKVDVGIDYNGVRKGVNTFQDFCETIKELVQELEATWKVTQLRCIEWGLDHENNFKECFDGSNLLGRQTKQKHHRWQNAEADYGISNGDGGGDHDGNIRKPYSV